MYDTIHFYMIIILASFLRISTTEDVCFSQRFKQLDHEYLAKDTDMCTLFVQSFVDSIDMKMSPKNYLLKYVPYKYLHDGHLSSLAQYHHDNTFLIASTIDQHDQEYKASDSVSEKTQLNYVAIDWSNNASEILDDIIEKFQIHKTCDTVITLYLTFPSYPENKLLANFFKNFESKVDQKSSLIDDVNNLSYRQHIHPSFFHLIDPLPLAVFQQLLRHYQNVRIVNCGHGFGGTIAQLSTLHLLSKGDNFHFTQLRSISLASLFFASEGLINHIENRHLKPYFINIYHEMDPVPSLFNVAELLSQSINLPEKEKKKPSVIESVISAIMSPFSNMWGPENLPRSHMKHLLSWLCHSLIKSYSSLSKEICDPVTIKQGLNLFNEALTFAQSILLSSKSTPKLMYQPMGVYNMIVFRQLDKTWQLIHVSNEDALYDHLIKDLERSKTSQKLFNNHSILSYMTDLQKCNLYKLDSHQQPKPLSSLLETLSSDKYVISSNINIDDKSDDHDVSIPLPFRFYNYVHEHYRSGASYMDMIAEKPATMLKYNTLNEKLLSALKFRTGLSNLNSISEPIKIKKRSNERSVYDACISLYEAYGVDARMELMKLQLDQRMLVPILVSKKEKNSPPFRSYIETLNLVETDIFQSQAVRLVNDTSFLRIGLISTIQNKIGGLPDLIQSLFQVLSLRQPVAGTGTGMDSEIALEIGYGFLPNAKSPSRYEPVILNHIIGNYQPLLSFLTQYVDVLIIEHDEDNKNYAELKYNSLFDSLRVRKIIQWKYTTEASFEETTFTKKPFSMYTFEGTPKAVQSELQKFLLEILHSKTYLYSNSPRPPLANIIKDRDLLRDDDIGFLDINALFRDVKTAEVKQFQFQLQESYLREAQSQFELDNPALQLNDARRKILNEKIHQERESRRTFALTQVNRIPILKSYLSIMSETNEEKRYVRKRQFEYAVAELNEKEIAPLRQKRDETFERMTETIENAVSVPENDTDYLIYQNKKQEAIAAHYKVKQNLIDASLNIEHFWREISHLYVTDEILYRKLPDLAAQHLIDGFSLELLDGHSMLLNKQWIKPVFNALNRKLYEELNRPARILVLSICGPQSSGKSTLLKTMFGIRVRASVGACTQGVNMMLVKVLDQDYDYILVIDTEGIRAPEYSFLPDASVRDNTLAAFAVLPADGTILLNKGEVNQALEDVLPIVLYLYATSSLSLQLGGRIQSKLFFVYNQIDPGQREKGTELLQNLNSRLLNMTDRIREAFSSQNMTLRAFELCRLDSTNLSNSDFRILSVNTDRPPINIPVDLFGEECLQLRHWIEQRIINKTGIKSWEARSISDIYDYIEIVSYTLRLSPHIASINAPLEMLENKKLNEQIEKIKYNVSSNYTIFRTEIENKIIHQNLSSQESVIKLKQSYGDVEDLISQAHNQVLQLMNETISIADDKLNKLIQGARRQESISEDWRSFITDKSYLNRRFLSTRIHQEISVKFLINIVEQKIRNDFISFCNRINCTALDKNETEKRNIFNEILQNRTTEFQQSDELTSINVDNEIRRVYNRSQVIASVKIFSEETFCQENGMFERLSIENDRLKYIENHESEIERKERNLRFKQENEKFQGSLDIIKEFTNDLIKDNHRYDSFIVSSILQRVDETISKHSIKIASTIADLHRGTYCHLTYALTKLQQKWDDEHNSTKHVEKNHDNLWKFFSNVALGIRSIKLFELELCNRLNETWKEGFLETLIQDVKTEVAKEHWIRNSDILSDYVDNEKIQILNESEAGTEGDIEKLLRELHSGNGFYEKSINKFVQEVVNNSVNDQWKRYYKTLMEAIDEAGRQAKDSPQDCLEIFLIKLRNQSIPSSMRNKLPMTTSLYGNVDEQPRHIFDSVIENLKSIIPNLTEPILLLHGNESTTVLDRIREEAPNDAAKPRCTHVCRLCGAPCYKHAGHQDYHDFYHQPAGLMGMRWHHTHLIAHETCYENHLRKNAFSVDQQNFHSYEKFPTMFNYSVPSAPSRRSHLTEYLMYKYHEKIAAFYGIKPNPPVPSDYGKHTLNAIKDDLKKNVKEKL